MLNWVQDMSAMAEVLLLLPGEVVTSIVCNVVDRLSLDKRISAVVPVVTAAVALVMYFSVGVAELSGTPVVAGGGVGGSVGAMVGRSVGGMMGGMVGGDVGRSVGGDVGRSVGGMIGGSVG